MSNHHKNRDNKRGGTRYMKFARNRKPRPKTFNTEEAANNWAKENDIKNYSLENVKNAESTRKKIRIVVN